MTSPGETLMLTSLSSYFEKNPDHRELMYRIVSGTSPISLRVIDWFVTHYAKAKHVFYWIDTQNREMVENPSQGGAHLRKVHLYLEYRAQLKSYTKVHFDPFRRHERISFVLERSPLRILETTIGQLNFFRWAIQMHVIDYIQAHLTEIEEHMSQKNREPVVGRREPAKQLRQAAHTHMASGCYLLFD